MPIIRLTIRKTWQTKPYESETIELGYEEDVPAAEIEERVNRKGLRHEDAAAELVTAMHISLDKALGAAMSRALARHDPRDVEPALAPQTPPAPPQPPPQRHPPGRPMPPRR